MDHQNSSGTDSSRATDRTTTPVTPSSDTERPEGLAFDVTEDADLAGVPAGDQTPRNPEAPSSTEKGEGVGLAIPADREQSPAPPSDGDSSQR
jgi:hypothetical protein